MKSTTDDPAPELFGPQYVARLITPIGRIWVESDEEHVLRVLFESPGRGRSGTVPKVLKEAERQLLQYFKGTRHAFDLPLPGRGSAFRARIWQELRRIPYGRVKSYQEIADRAGGSARAAGGACAANPVPIIVPCHRVLSSHGALTGYIGGLWRKRWLLEHEGVLQRELFNES